MRTLPALACVAVAVLLQPSAGRAESAAVSQIKALEASFATAFNAKDINAIMKTYAPDVFVFDLVPPRQYVGAAAYRKDWEDFFGDFDGPVKFEISDLAVVAERNLGYSHSIQHLSGTNKKGQPVDITVRVTDAYRKTNGQWLVTVEHVSVPVDLQSGKPDLQSKP